MRGVFEVTAEELQELRAKYTVLREEINKRYKLIDLVRRYLPNATEKDAKMPSLIANYGGEQSMILNYGDGTWRCYSTGSGGGYLDLLYKLQVEREGSTESKYKMADNILRHDFELQKVMGIKTIYTHTLPTEVNINIRQSRNRRQRGENTEAPLKSLQKIAKELSELDDLRLFYDFISDSEKNMSEQELRTKYNNARNGVLTTNEKEDLESFIKNLLEQ